MYRIKLMTVACAALAVLAMDAGNARAADLPALTATCESDCYRDSLGQTHYKVRAKARVTNGGANKAVSISYSIKAIKNGVTTTIKSGTLTGMTNELGIFEQTSDYEEIFAPVPTFVAKVEESGTCGIHMLNPHSHEVTINSLP